MNNAIRDEEDSVEVEDLDFDMWEGQFEFIGPSPTEYVIKNIQGSNGFKKLHGIPENSERVCLQNWDINKLI